DMQGRSLVPLLEGKTPDDWRKSVYYHYYEFPQPHHVHPHLGIRTERYKLIHFYTIDEWELFDLEKDPHELKSIYDDPASAELVKDLKKQLEGLKAQYKDDGTVVKFQRPDLPAKGKKKKQK
ncbi:MAG: sulfatase/phosphatase domain-containing protein, partial [Pirellulaceae bacterium]